MSFLNESHRVLLRQLLLAFLLFAFVTCLFKPYITLYASTKPPERQVVKPAVAFGEFPSTVRDNIEKRQSEGLCQSLAIALIDEKGTSYHFFGQATKSSLFEIGSITKVFTATLLANMLIRQEVEFGSIACYLPKELKLEPTTKNITLRQLAQHTSGLPRLPENLDPEAPADPYADYTKEALYTYLKTFKAPDNLPTQYAYSNLGAGLLGHLLSRAGGKSYEELVRQRICEPLAMTDTAIELSKEQQALLLHGHYDGNVVPHWNFHVLAGCGAFRSTIVDMARFARANLGLVVTPLRDTLEATRRFRCDTNVPKLKIELGWHLWQRFDEELVWHNGGTFGFHSFLGFMPRRIRAVVVLSNSFENVDDIGLHLLDNRWPLTTMRPSLRLFEVLKGKHGCDD